MSFPKPGVLAIAVAMLLTAANAPAAISSQERASLQAIYRALDGPALFEALSGIQISDLLAKVKPIGDKVQTPAA